MRGKILFLNQSKIIDNINILKEIRIVCRYLMAKTVRISAKIKLFLQNVLSIFFQRNAFPNLVKGKRNLNSQVFMDHILRLDWLYGKRLKCYWKASI